MYMSSLFGARTEWINWTEKSLAEKLGSLNLPNLLKMQEGTLTEKQHVAASKIEGEAKDLHVLPSKGSALHEAGKCKPCSWFFKAQGCANGSECLHCHSCSEGELKRRKKAKIAMYKRLAEEPVRLTANGVQHGRGLSVGFESLSPCLTPTEHGRFDLNVLD